jgi:hypothetical protein
MQKDVEDYVKGCTTVRDLPVIFVILTSFGHSLK